VTNAAFMLINSGTLSVTNGYSQTSGTTTISSVATLANTIPFAMNGGSLEGSGIVTGTVLHYDGIIRPGGSSSIGILQVEKLLQVGNTGILQVECASDSSYDILQVVTTNLSSIISMEFYYSPENGTTFEGVIEGIIYGNVTCK
jgi:hypothetical protein